jgi:hypothetical protein
MNSSRKVRLVLKYAYINQPRKYGRYESTASGTTSRAKRNNFLAALYCRFLNHMLEKLLIKYAYVSKNAVGKEKYKRARPETQRLRTQSLRLLNSEDIID